MSERKSPVRNGTGNEDGGTVFSAWSHELTTAELYALLQLRVDVFVVEQQCPYPEIDGRDLSPGTRHFWMSEQDRVVGCLRLLTESDGLLRVGRVCTARDVRRLGLGARLMQAAMACVGDSGCVLDAQTYAQSFYARFGFRPVGEEFLEDDIPHVVMRKEPR